MTSPQFTSKFIICEIALPFSNGLKVSLLGSFVTSSVSVSMLVERHLRTSHLIWKDIQPICREYRLRCCCWNVWSNEQDFISHHYIVAASDILCECNECSVVQIAMARERKPPLSGEVVLLGDGKIDVQHEICSSTVRQRFKANLSRNARNLYEPEIGRKVVKICFFDW